MKANAVRDIVASFIVYALLAVFLILTISMPSQSALYPKFIIGIMGFLNTIMFIRALLIFTRTKEKFDNKELKFSMIPIYTFVIAVVYVILFRLTNYYIATAVMLAALMVFYRIKSIFKIISVVVIYSLFIYVLFTWQLNVPLF